MQNNWHRYYNNELSVKSTKNIKKKQRNRIKCTIPTRVRDFFYVIILVLPQKFYYFDCYANAFFYLNIYSLLFCCGSIIKEKECNILLLATKYLQKWGIQKKKLHKSVEKSK